MRQLSRNPRSRRGWHLRARKVLDIYPTGGLEIDHIDRDITNNNKDNLRVVTIRANRLNNAWLYSVETFLEELKLTRQLNQHLTDKQYYYYHHL